MKRIKIRDTMIKNKRNLQSYVMILCFIYAGISALLFIYQLYFWVRRGMAPLPINLPITVTAENFINESIPRRFTGPRGIQMNSSIILAVSFTGTIISSLAGITIMDLVKKKETKEIRTKTMDVMLMPEEKLIILLLNKNSGELSQSELVKRSKLSKLKVSRVIKRLEMLKVVSKHPYGVTNKIVLEKHMQESN